MPSSQQASFLRHLRQLATASRPNTESDRQLLARFLADRDEAAFAVLVQRHGPMVLGVCRSVLGQQQDAEDVFQATFLVLARKGGAIRKQESVGSWLHGVAYRLALKTKTRAAKRQTQQTAAPPPPPISLGGPLEDLSVREWQAILHEELARLPEKYRAALLLCYWEGKTRDEAAQQLGLARGTLREQLERARNLLRSRLVRRGVTPSLALFTMLFVHNPAEALASTLATSTIKAGPLFAASSATDGLVSPAALALVQGAIRTMQIKKWTITAFVLFFMSSLASGLGFLAITPGREADKQSVRRQDQVKNDEPERIAPLTDAFDDPLPPGALVRLGTLRLRQGLGVSFLAFTADGKTIVYAGAGGVDNVIRTVDARTGKELHSFQLKPSEPLWQPIGPPLGLPTLSPDGKMLAIAWSDGSTWNVPEKIRGTVYVWDTATGKVLWRIEGAGIPWRPTFSPDSKLLLTVEKGQLHIWDAATGKKLHDFNDFEGTVGQPLFSADGKLLVLDSFLKDRAESRALLFVDTTTWKQARPAVPLKDASLGYLHGFSPDGKWLIGDDPTGHLCFVEAATGKLIERVLADTQATPSSLTSVSFSPDGKMLAVVVRDGRVTLWDVATRKLLHKVEGAFGTAEFSPVGEPLLATGSNGPALRFWDPRTAREIPINDAPYAPVQMTFWLPEGKVLAVYPAEHGYRLWDARSGKQLARVTTSDRYIWWAVASPDGRFLAISNWRGQVGDDEATHLFDLQTGKEVPRQGPKDFLGSIPIRFTSDGRFLIASEVVKGAEEPSVESRMVMWETTTGKVTVRPDLNPQKWELKGGVNRSVASADGKLLVLEMAVRVPPPPEITFDRGGYLEQEYYWCGVDVTTGKVRWRTDQVKQTDALALSADGKVVACGVPGKVQLRNAATGALLYDLDCHTKYPRPWSYGQLLAFTSDGKKFIATDAGTKALVWDVATGKELHQFAGHRGRILSVSVSPDNTMFATASEDSTVLLWRLDAD